MRACRCHGSDRRGTSSWTCGRDARGHLVFGGGHGIGEGDVVAIAFGVVEVSQGRIKDNFSQAGITNNI